MSRRLCLQPLGAVHSPAFAALSSMFATVMRLVTGSAFTAGRPGTFRTLSGCRRSPNCAYRPGEATKDQGNPGPCSRARHQKMRMYGHSPGPQLRLALTVGKQNINTTGTKAKNDVSSSWHVRSTTLRRPGTVEGGRPWTTGAGLPSPTIAGLDTGADRPQRRCVIRQAWRVRQLSVDNVWPWCCLPSKPQGSGRHNGPKLRSTAI